MRASRDQSTLCSPHLKQPSHALRPVTTGNAISTMYYRNCWHIFGPRLPDKRRASYSAPTTRMLVQTFVHWPIFLTAAYGGAVSNPRWLADR